MSLPLTRSSWACSPTFLGWIWKYEWAGLGWVGLDARIGSSPRTSMDPQCVSGPKKSWNQVSQREVSSGVSYCSVFSLIPQLFITALVRGSLWVTFKGQGQQLGSDYESIERAPGSKKISKGLMEGLLFKKKSTCTV